MRGPREDPHDGGDGELLAGTSAEGGILGAGIASAQALPPQVLEERDGIDGAGCGQAAQSKRCPGRGEPRALTCIDVGGQLGIADVRGRVGRIGVESGAQ